MLNWLLGRSPEKSTPIASRADAQHYVDSVAHLPRPTLQQIAEFVEYVSTAHSWYKHLPLIPPGRPFTFYLDPNAGREWIESDSRGHFRERVANAPADERFHYTWQPTSDYLARFGYLNYFAEAGTSFRVPMKNGVLNTASAPRIQVENRNSTVVNRSWITVPEEIRREGTVYLTGVIHPIAQRVGDLFMKQRLLGSYGGRPLDTRSFDASTADDLTRTAVRLLRRVLLDSGDAEPLSEIEELEKRVLPAWAQVQKRQMSQAIDRMLDRIYTGRISSPLSDVR